jgi:hypothetical protein
MKTIKLLVATFLLIGCSTDSEESCNCEKKLYLYTPPVFFAGQTLVPAKMEYVRSLYNQCGTTDLNPQNISGSDYNKVVTICE